MQRVSRDSLTEFAVKLLTDLDAPRPTAESVATSLVEADARGHSSHGVFRIPYYADMIEHGMIDVDASPTVAHKSGTTALVHGHSTFGQVVGRKAVDVASTVAHDHGVGIVGVRDASHLGRIGEWAEQTSTDGLLFAAFVNTQGGGFTVTAPGSADRLFATNPVALGVPTFDELPFPIVLDMATSQVAHGKIRERASKGETIPADWAIDETGDPVTDPVAFENGTGALLPLGGTSTGYKGFGLAVITELFAGIVSNGVVAGQRESDWPSNAAAFIAIDPTRFSSPKHIRAQVAAIADHVRTADYSDQIPTGPSSKGDQAVLPGEPEYERAQESTREGIALTSRIVTSLREFAIDRGLSESIPPELA